jgi:hypothetical protein
MSQQLPEQIPPPSRSHFEKYKKPILVSLAVIMVTMILFVPFIPVQYAVTKTRTVKLQYSSQLYDKVYGSMDLGPWFVNVTNKDSISGSFSVTMNWWRNNPAYPLSGPQRYLEDTSTQSLSINPKVTETFYLPSDWTIIEPLYSFTYSVSAPSKQENYNVTNTKYESIIDLIRGS